MNHAIKGEIKLLIKYASKFNKIVIRLCIEQFCSNPIEAKIHSHWTVGHK